MRRACLAIVACIALATCAPPRERSAPGGAVPSERSREIARYAVDTYAEEAVEMLADLVAFKTVHQEGVANVDNPEFRGMVEYLAATAAGLGLDFADHGAVLIVGLGDGDGRLGIVAHGDVQPADAAKWATDPFELDAASEPGRLVGRGSEDDKGPIACALYAMKALVDRELPLGRRIELIIALTEESDWDPIRAFFADWQAPDINIAFDAEYPVVIAEKGWGQITVTLASSDSDTASGPRLAALRGGAFLSQVPEDAEAVIDGADASLEAALRQAAAEIAGAAETGDPKRKIDYEIEPRDAGLVVRARGISAHSGSPWEGTNAITHLAALLARFDWPDSGAAHAVRFIDDLVGTGDNAEKFGDLAYAHPFMGPLTLTLATATLNDDGATELGISFRRPVGRSSSEVESSVHTAIDAWQQETGADLVYEAQVYDPYLAENAPQVPVLLDVFRHYTGIEDAQPVSMGGGTNVRLLPNGVTFGPSMPGVLYTGHSEHEFITREQFELNLEMYTAVLAELAGR